MAKKTMSKWRPASMGAIKGKILGVPKHALFWGAGGATASLLTSYIAGSIMNPLEMPALSPTLVGALISSVSGFALMFDTKGYQRAVVPWVVGSIVPVAAKAVYDIFFVTPPLARTQPV